MASAVLGLMFAGLSSCYAHEAWVLTPAEMAEWNAKPLPDMFVHLMPANVILTVLAIAVVIGWIFIGKSKAARNLMPSVRLRLESLTPYATLAIRVGLGIMLAMAAFGLNPRVGGDVITPSTLVAPDLELSRLSAGWAWLAWLEGYCALSLILGVHVRSTAVLVLIADMLGVMGFGYDMLAYAGIVAAGPVYLLVSGPGPIRLPFPEGSDLKIFQWFASQSIERAQFVSRLLLGINFVYLGIEYKFHHANLSMALVEMQHVFTFGLEPQTFVFCMFLVETSAGILLIAGQLIRPLAAVLFAAFLFLSYALHENPIGHIIVYGQLVSFLMIGAGAWHLRASSSAIPVLQPDVNRAAAGSPGAKSI